MTNCGGPSTKLSETQSDAGTTENFPLISPQESAALGLSTTSKAGFLFTGLDKNYSSSSVFFYDFRTGFIQRKRSGESGDPKLFNINNFVYLVNRRPESHNYVRIDPFQDFKNYNGLKQVSLETSLGDPENAMPWANQDVLFTFPNQKYILKLNPNTAQFRTYTLLSNFHFVQFHPFDMVLAPNDPTTLFVSHLGVGFEMHRPDGSQGIYKFKISPTGELTHSTVDDRIRLNTTYGAKFYPQSNGTYLMVGLCSKFVSGCKQGIDSFDPQKGLVTPLKIENKLDWFLNGQIIQDKADGCFYSQLMDAQENKIVASICLKKLPRSSAELLQGFAPYDLSLKIVHTYPKDSSGTGLLAYDPRTGTLFIGDSTLYGQGLLHIYKNKQKRGTLGVDLIPYQGVTIF